MPIQFAPARPWEQAEIAKFLVSSFNARAGAPFVEDKLLRWKYFEERQDWTPPRSYLLTDADRIVAHGCVHPVMFLAPGRIVRSMRFIDWAGSPSVPGAGILLIRRMAELVDALLAVGGSSQTQQILPKAGFRIQGEVAVFARPVRPVLQLRRRPSPNWKAPLKAVRNAIRAAAPAAPRKGWSAETLERFAEGAAPMPHEGARTFTPAQRSPELLNYLLRCPGAKVSAYRLCDDRRRARGYFVLSCVGGQTRIADLYLDSEVPADWLTAFSVALHVAVGDPETCELSAAASIPLAADALAGNGFRLCRRDPVFVYDPLDLLKCAPPLHLTLLDGDEFYLSDPAHPFLT